MMVTPQFVVGDHTNCGKNKLWQGLYHVVYGPGCQANVVDSMTINRLLIGKTTKVINKVRNIITTDSSIVYYMVFGQ